MKEENASAEIALRYTNADLSLKQLFPSCRSAPEALIWLSQSDNLRNVTERHDPTLDVLLDLDGQVFVVDPEGGHWVKFVVTPVPVSPEKPHGIDYSLTLHGPDGERLVGFDNAHPVEGQQRGGSQDHRHGLRTITAYEYSDAATLMADFWNAVDAVLRERGVLP